MNNKTFGNIRTFLGKTQKQLAQFLCVSVKAIQSYEQGWRNIPSTIERQIMILSAMKKLPDMNGQPCWEIKNCPDQWRANCIVWELQMRQFCWFLNGTFCQGQLQGSWDNKIKICRDCEVYKLTFPIDLATISDSTDYSI